MKHVLVIALILCAGCQKSRADYRDDVARSVCAQMKTCQKIGPDGKFANFDDCVTDISSRYNKLWSAKKCEQRIDPQKFAACKSRAMANACDGNVLDALSFKIECGANDVCIAEPPAAP